MTPDIQDAITRAAQEEGVDPAFALAVADRESAGNPNAKASRSIYGLFQMRDALRNKYGAGDSSDPYTQTKAWARFINETRSGLTQRLGRDPTNSELYLAHYFGEGRAARMANGQIAPSTPVNEVFTPQELAGNPNIGHAGTVGALTSNIGADIGARQAAFGGGGNNNAIPMPSRPTGIDFASYGLADGETGQPIDFASYGTGPLEATTNRPPSGTPADGTEIDFSKFGQTATADNAPPSEYGLMQQRDIQGFRQDLINSAPATGSRGDYLTPGQHLPDQTLGVPGGREVVGI